MTEPISFRWKIEEIEFLKKFYSNFGSEYCSEKLKRSTKSICHKARRMGLKINKIEHSKRHSQKLINNFDESNNGIKDIGAWKIRVLYRDDYTCQECGLHCPKIAVAHHVKPCYLYPELRYDVDNGQVLCPNCHALKHYNLKHAGCAKRLSTQDKERIKSLRTNGVSISEVASMLGVNKKTVAKYSQYEKVKYDS